LREFYGIGFMPPSYVGKSWRGFIAALSFDLVINQIGTISSREQEWHLTLFCG
jgi:hypothetical protein